MTSGAQRLAPHPNCHEAIKVIDVQLRVQNKTRKWLAARSGISPRTLEDWWAWKCDPKVSMLEAALGVFEMRLKPSSMEKKRDV